MNCNGLVLDFSTSVVMGILNLTPDSFHDGGKYSRQSDVIKQVERMLIDGAQMIDIGAVSTRPGSESITIKEELKRLIEPLQQLLKQFPNVIFSIDTYRSEVARACIDNGAHIINDISGGKFDNQMFETIAELGVPYILMHLKGEPKDMQINPISTDVKSVIRSFFEVKVKTLQELGLKDIILDPGFGFGKTLDCNYSILKDLEALRIAGLPILAGISRKSMINKVLNCQPNEASNGSTVLHTIALLNGANILRVHDVKEAVEAVRIVEYSKLATNCD